MQNRFNFNPPISKALPWVAVLAVAFLAIWPFIRTPSLPNTTDAELHVFRLAELSRLVRTGILYPRWAPNFYFGYGYPIFNYYAPLSYYVGLLFELLPGVDAVLATKLVFMLGIGLGGIGTFGFVRAVFKHEKAALVAAALFMYAPYIQYIDPHARGVLAETLALGLLPVAMWWVTVLVQTPSYNRFIIATVSIAAALVSHNLMAMVSGGILLTWLVWLAVSEYIDRDRSGTLEIGWGVGALGIGIMMTSLFWVPLVLERDEVNLTTLVGETGSHYAFSSHFLSLRELLSPSLLLDWGATESPYLFNYGLTGWLAGLCAILLVINAIRLGEWRRIWQPLFFILGALFMLWLMLPASTRFWAAIPLIQFMQFPWRLLGPSAFVLAVCGGYAFSRLPSAAASNQSIWVRFDVSVAILLIFVVGLPLTQVKPWASFGETTQAAVTAQETRGRWLGTTSTADFIPVTVDTVPAPEGQMLEALFNNSTPDRINYSSVPNTASIDWEEVTPLHHRYQVRADETFLLRLFLFEFPGWQVRLNGDPIQTQLGRPEGFIVIPVPAGSHEIEVEFVETRARRIGRLLSLFSLVMIMITQRSFKEEPIDIRSEPTGRLSWSDVAIPVTFTLTVLLLPQTLFHYESSGLTAAPAGIPLSADFDRQIALIGADVSDRTPSPGETIQVRLYWKAQRPIEINYQPFIHLLAEDGFLKSQSDKLNPGDFPTKRWPLDQYVVDEYDLLIPADTLPGRYTIKAGLWVSTEGWRLPVLDGEGTQIGDNTEIIILTVE